MSMLLGVLVLAGLAVIAVECLARVHVRRSPYRILSPGREDLMQMDNETLPAVEPFVRYAINRHGERGDERPSDPNAFRVLAAGGSATMCYFLDQHTAWPGELQRLLQQHPALAGRPVHVGNVGKSSVDSGSLELMRSRILPQEPKLDVLLIMVGASDILRWLMIEAPVDRAVEANELDECFDRHPEVRCGWHPKRWALATLYRWRRDSKRTDRVNAGRRYATARRMRANALETRTRVPDSTVVIARFERCMRGLLEAARARVEHVIVVRQPWFDKSEYLPSELAQFWSGSVGDAYMQQATIFYSPDVVAALMRRIDECAARVCLELGVPEVNLFPTLTSSNDNYCDQFHFTPAGSRIVADAVFQKIVSFKELLEVANS